MELLLARTITIISLDFRASEQESEKKEQLSARTNESESTESEEFNGNCLQKSNQLAFAKLAAAAACGLTANQSLFAQTQ